MRRVSIVFAFFMSCVGLGSPVWADSLSIDDASGMPGKSVRVPVRLNTTHSVAGVQARILYDDSMLESPDAERGDMSSADMFFDTSCSEPGVVNVVLCTGGGQQVLTKSSGIAFYLLFSVRRDAVLWTHSTISFDSDLPSPFSVSGTSLSTLAGAELDQTLRNATFTVGKETNAGNWTLYD